MSEALSAERITEIAAWLGAHPVGDEGAPPLRLGLRIRGANGDGRQLTFVIGGGLPGTVLEDGEADVVLVESEETAARLVSGSAIAEELAAGRVKIEGDVAKLLNAERELNALATALSEG